MEYVVLTAVIVFFVIAVFVKEALGEKKRQKNFAEKLRRNYGQEPDKNWKKEYYENLERYHEKHRSAFEIDDITWNDLGMEQVFKRLDYTLSRTGAEYLYHTLRTPAFDATCFRERKPKIEYFMTEEKERVLLQLQFSKLGTTGKYSLYDYIDRLDILGERSNAKHYLINAGFVGALAFLAVEPSAGMIMLFALTGYSVFSYFSEKAQIAPYITSFAYVLRLLHVIDKLKSIKAPVLKKELTELNECRNKVRRFEKGSYIVMSSDGSGNPLEIVLDYVRMIFHSDLIKFNSMLSEVRKHYDEIDRMITLLGEIELCLSIGAFRASLEEYCEPEFINENRLHMDKGYHLLLREPIKNSITADKGVLLTGSNASGKSTFLKTVALNALLAETVYTCTADSFSLPFCRIYSSMSLRDDMISGDSYFMVEIKALKRILEAAEEAKEKPVLCFIDEVLRGTNTVERIAASTELLEGLYERQVMTFAATHDVELTRLLAEHYANYHFEEEIIGDDVVFSYELKAGYAKSRNAIRLLEVMGYDAAIVEKAQKRAEIFMQEGVWEK